jgi:hypothetical protein
LQEEDPAWRSVVIRSRRYLNNIVEQDHRAIKSRCAPMLAFKSFRSAAVTLAALSSHTVFASANSPLVVPGRGGCLLPSSFELVHWRVMTLRLKILRRNPRRGTATAPELRCSHADRHPTASSQATTLCTKVVGWRGACISW